MGFFDQIFNAQKSSDLAGVQYQEPSMWDRLLASKFGGDLPTPEKFTQLRDARLGHLQSQEAAPVAGQLARFAAEGNDADPNFTGAEWVKGMMTTPALGGSMTEAEYDALKSGAVPGGKKGAMPITAFGYNPKVAEYLQNAELAAQQKGTLARVLGSNDLATVAMNNDLSKNFKETSQGAENTLKAGEMRQKPIDEAIARKNLADFMDSTSMLATPMQRTGKFMPFGEASELINQAAADYPVKPEVVNQVTDNLLKQYKETRRPASGKVGRTTWTGTENLLGDVNKDASSTAPNIRIDNGDKNPVFYLVQKPDGRLVQVDATTPDGKARLAAARRNGEKISKMATESSSATTINADGSTATKRVSGPATTTSAEPTVTVVRDKSGKLVIKR